MGIEVTAVTPTMGLPPTPRGSASAGNPQTPEEPTAQRKRVSVATSKLQRTQKVPLGGDMPVDRRPRRVQCVGLRAGYSHKAGHGQAREKEARYGAHVMECMGGVLLFVGRRIYTWPHPPQSA